MNARDACKKLLLSGHCIEYKNISICRISDYCPRTGCSKEYKFGWQVDCDSGKLSDKVKDADKNGYSRIHVDLDRAISIFLKIKRVLYGNQSSNKGKD